MIDFYFNNLILRIFIFFIIGMVVGSFASVLIFRKYNFQNFLKKISSSSYCHNCNQKIKIYHNIPIFSYLFLNGRCFYCRKKYSITYFLIEVFFGFLFSIVSVLFNSISYILIFDLLILIFCVIYFHKKQYK